MNFLHLDGFTVKPGKLPEFQQWVETHLDELKESYPEGTSLEGIYVSVFGSDKNAGDVWMVERLDSYAALDRVAALGKDPESEYSKLGSEIAGFIDISPTAPWSNLLLKDVVDATVYRLPEEPVREPVLSEA